MHLTNSECPCGHPPAALPDEDLRSGPKPCLLPAGVISFEGVRPLFGGRRVLLPGICVWKWHDFDAADAAECISVMNEVDLIKCIDNLVTLGFIRVLGRVHEPSGEWKKLKADSKNKAFDQFKKLLRRLFVDHEYWTCDDYRLPNPTVLMPQKPDNRTMAEIYSDIASPVVNANISIDHPDGDLVTDILSGAVPGLRSTLFRYQQRTVSAMIAREISPSSVTHPLYLKLNGPTGAHFYLQATTMEVLAEVPVTQQSRGGVLCEELGTGKTVMTLALVLSTLHQLPQPLPNALDSSSEALTPSEADDFTRQLHKLQDRCAVLTPRALKTFPAQFFNNARSLAGYSSAPPSQGRNKGGVQASAVPSLVELLVHFVQTTKYQTLLKRKSALRYERLGQTHPRLLAQLCGTAPFDHVYPEGLLYSLDPSFGQRRRKGDINIAPRPVLLTSATLIVVPLNLFNQWKNEINKHCDTTSLRICSIGAKDKMLPAQELATSYDIVLIIHPRFSAEGKKANKLHVLQRAAPCQCPDIPGSRVFACTCISTGHPSVSPLLQIRWKRLVVDEGHILADADTTLSKLAHDLDVERRWIVTGTPTSHLLGLKFGSAAVERDLEDWEAHDHDAPAGDGDGQTPRRWTKADTADLRKLEEMLSNVVQVPLFAGNSAESEFSKLVRAPLRGSSGPEPGAVRILEQVMQMTMLRHRIEDVEECVVLPPILQENVLLDLHDHARKSYNVLQAMLVVNAVDSQRKDQDYMFHPRNVQSLRATVEQVNQIMFWAANEEGFRSKETLSGMDESIARARERIVEAEEDATKLGLTTEADILALFDAQRCLKDALEDEEWEAAMQGHGDLPFQVIGLSNVLRSWSRYPTASSTLAKTWMHADPLLHCRDVALQKPLTTEPTLASWGALFNELDILNTRIGNIEHVTRKRASVRNKNEIDEVLHKVAKVKRTPREVHREMDRRLNQQRDSILKQLKATGAPLEKGLVSSTSSLLVRSPLARVRVGPSASSKVNFILNEVLQHAVRDKFLIFSASPLSLAHLKEALDLAGVPALEFTGRVSARAREQFVTTFETSDTFRVFLMELKHGARGLNLVSARRVIFCEPVWQPDVESQAIKRVHRIGQTRPVIVQTLAIRGTAEEMMLEQRAVLKGQKPPTANWMEQNEMRAFVEHPRFLEATADTAHTPFAFPLIPGLPAVTLVEPRAVAPAVRSDKPTIRIPGRKTPSPSKARKEGPPDGPSPPKRARQAQAVRFNLEA